MCQSVGTNRYFIGLSLSFCIKEILLGKVDLADVEYISTATMCKTEADWNLLVENYSRVYWKMDPSRAALILSQLRKEGRIYQPRIYGNEPEPIHNGYWRRNHAEPAEPVEGDCPRRSVCSLRDHCPVGR